MSKPLLLLIAKILIMTLLFAYVFKNVDFREIKAHIDGINLTYLFLACLTLVFQFGINVYRWKITLDTLHCRIPWQTLLRYSWSALFFNQALPGGSLGGDASRVWLLHKRGHAIVTTTSSIIIGHIGMLMGLLMLSATGLITTVAVANPLPSALALLYWFVPLLLLGLMVGVWVLYAFGQHFPKPIPTLRHNVRLMLHHPQALTAFALLSVLTCLLLIVASLLLGRALGTTVPWITFLRLMPLVIVVSVLPISIGGWGPRETAMILLFSHAGMSNSAAFTVSSLLAICTIFISLPGALLYLLDRGPQHKAIE